MARTRAADYGEKQRAILESAATVFAVQGMEKASMAQIARQANVSKALLYHYYPSKDALIFGIVRTHLLDLESAVECADDASLAPETQLRAMVWAVLEQYRGADTKHNVQINGTQNLSEDQKEALRVIERRIVRRFAQALLRISPALETSERSLTMPVTMSLFGMLNWVYHWFRDGGALSREAYADLASTLILTGVKGLK
ncbi:MAG: TetR family transcriptional regulator [Hyphomicrobiales bacterium]|nr:TetR family transcriptional regulator [Hyphomicrobiales bacterium]